MATCNEVKAWAEAQGLRSWTHGKNVIRGNVNIRCPWCDDPSNHLNINPERERFFCWRCPAKGSLTDLIAAVQGVSKSEAAEIRRRLFTFQGGEEREEISHPDVLQMPSYFERKPGVIHARYLQERGFNWRKLQKDFDIRFVGNRGDFKFRVVAPVIMDGRLVSYIGRDVTGKASLRYKVLSDDKAVLPRRSLLYNVDSVKRGGTAVIVEGVTDVWRLGPGAVATLSVAFTPQQVAFLRKKEISRAFILYDQGADEQAERLANALYWADVEIVTLDKYDDPAELPDKFAEEFMRQVII